MFRIPQKMIGYYRTQTIKLPTIFLTGHRCSYQEGKVGIPLTGLTLPHFCACPKLGPGFSTYPFFNVQ
jgi:hypothetical protein